MKYGINKRLILLFIESQPHELNLGPDKKTQINLLKQSAEKFTWGSTDFMIFLKF